ncbi:MAG TPA: ATPase, partial [Methanocorpusculum sp.]|nr:ATPase [Methanocorpusculum sp.]
FADLRLSGIKVIGGLHANSAADALIRLTSLVDINLIPQIVSTMVFVKTGDISEIYNVSMEFGVPKALDKIGDPQVRPIIKLTNVISRVVEAEAFRYEGEVVVMPDDINDKAKDNSPSYTAMSDSSDYSDTDNRYTDKYTEKYSDHEDEQKSEPFDYDEDDSCDEDDYGVLMHNSQPIHSMPTYEVTKDNPAWMVLEKEIQSELCRYTEGDIIVRIISDTKAAVYIDDIDVPAAIGKAGKNIVSVVNKVGIGIDVRPLSDLPGRETLFGEVQKPERDFTDFKLRSEKKQLSIICPEYKGKIVDLFSGREYLFTATVDETGEIHLAKSSSIANEMIRRYGAGEELKIRPVD